MDSQAVIRYVQWQIDMVKEYAEVVEYTESTQEDKDAAYQKLIRLGVIDENGNLTPCPVGAGR